MNMDINFPNLHIYLKHVGKGVEIFGFPIAFYGMVIALGMVLGVSLILHRAKKDGLDPDQCLDICIFTIIFSVIGARIYLHGITIRIICFLFLISDRAALRFMEAY